MPRLFQPQAQSLAGDWKPSFFLMLRIIVTNTLHSIPLFEYGQIVARRIVVTQRF